MGRSLLTSAVHGRNMSSLFRQKKRVDAEGQRNELCWSFCSPHQTQSAIFQTALCFALLPSDLQLGLSNCSQQWEMRRQEGRKFRVFIPHAPSLLGWRLLKAVFLCHSNSYVVCPKTTCRSLWVPGITPSMCTSGLGWEMSFGVASFEVLQYPLLRSFPSPHHYPFFLSSVPTGGCHLFATRILTKNILILDTSHIRDVKLGVGGSTLHLRINELL